MLDHLAPAGKLEHGLTQGPGDEARLATEAIARGFRRIVAVGGDGTWSNVANAILKTGEPASLGLVPGGTGCDLAKTLGIPARDVAACCRIVLAGATKKIDVGRVEDRHFLNIAGFGYDVAVLEDSWSVSYLEGSLLLSDRAGFRDEALQESEGGPGVSVDSFVDTRQADRLYGGPLKVYRLGHWPNNRRGVNGRYRVWCP